MDDQRKQEQLEQQARNLIEYQDRIDNASTLEELLSIGKEVGRLQQFDLHESERTNARFIFPPGETKVFWENYKNKKSHFIKRIAHDYMNKIRDITSVEEVEELRFKITCDRRLLDKAAMDEKTKLRTLLANRRQSLEAA